MTVTTIAGSGHTVFRDDHVGFLSLVNEWLTRYPAMPVGAV